MWKLGKKIEMFLNHLDFFPRIMFFKIEHFFALKKLKYFLHFVSGKPMMRMKWSPGGFNFFIDSVIKS